MLHDTPLSPSVGFPARLVRSAWVVATLTWSLAWHGPLRQH